MSTRVQFLALLLLSMLLPSSALADETVELFNGKDLTGWTKRGGNATYRVENGEIVGSSAPNTTNTFLCADKEFKDFEMELDFKIDPKDNLANSGVQLRSHSRPEGNQERVYGYQVEIDTKADRPWTGGIYFEGGSKDEKGEWIRKGQWLNDLTKNEAAQKERHLGEWNHLKIVFKDHHIQTWLNGVQAADYTETDEKAFSPQGFIALQVHAVGKLTEPREVRFKNLKLTELN